MKFFVKTDERRRIPSNQTSVHTSQPIPSPKDRPSSLPQTDERRKKSVKLEVRETSSLRPKNFRQIDELTTPKSILPMESTYLDHHYKPDDHLQRRFVVTMNKLPYCLIFDIMNIPIFWQYFHLIFSNFDLICFSNSTKILGGHVRYANIALLLQYHYPLVLSRCL